MSKGLQLRCPQTAAEWQAYYQLRWQVLRAPWQQPLGSEQDELEAQSVHLMLVAENGDIAAVGRLHQLDAYTAQVRYMAVADAWQGQGAGGMILQGLEQQAIALGLQAVLLNARDTALKFYLKQGYQVIGSAATQFGIQHHRMQKTLVLAGNIADWTAWCQTLQQTWHDTIPLSAYMQLNIDNFDGYQLQCSAPLAPNINLHHTMFAGSIYTLATLTGWGLLYLQLQSLGLSGAQVLAEANMRYFKPIKTAPQAICRLAEAKGDLTALSKGRKVQQQIRVELHADGELCAEFNGRYAVLPEQ
ncbi:GNAT family N-acetyltransferase [Alishewanella longhuensis]|uniref:GNAT family N-acetyltransferase n=1 Tax=Alishewanella longhuensis TaxID=1091037 RepID=A0ABQ3KXG0_9ALTE|nr:bifunctional GNAT family N-acetyltransferase/hotdog fold thioesterase [Alishewanella longhuensis]GHG61954.1 GNAT family N-acetyltransferase [Alishewanella longhuensis]